MTSTFFLASQRPEPKTVGWKRPVQFLLPCALAVLAGLYWLTQSKTSGCFRLLDHQAETTTVGLPLSDGRVLLFPQLPNFRNGRGACQAQVYAPVSGDQECITVNTIVADGRVTFSHLTLDRRTDSTPSMTEELLHLQDPAHPLLGIIIAKSLGLLEGRYDSKIFLLPNANLLILGGYLETRAPGKYLKRRDKSGQCELYDARTGQLLHSCSMHFPRRNFAAAVLPDGRVLISGGLPTAAVFSEDVRQSVEIYDPKLNCSNLAAPLRSPRVLHSVTVLDNGAVLTAGGLDFDRWSIDSSSNVAELYVPTVGTVAQMNMCEHRADHYAIKLASGNVLLLGGENHWKRGLLALGMESDPNSSHTCELYVCPVHVHER